MISNIKIGINGFGRIGRLVFRCALAQGTQVIAINDPSSSIFIPSAEHMVNMLKHDSTHEHFKGEVSHKDKKFIVAGQKISTLIEQQPSNIPWDELGVEYVVETIGVYTTIDKCQSYLQAGAKKVIIAEPSTDTPMFVMGVNEDKYTGKETVLSITSCTTNC
ncbi:unnamed protein product [Rotaria sp. Silwood2]|nr:unnamed protein product [Rotaria sp. Silwood2]CAF2749415.1 unnamed protein product [Rotaria sp. Silwood2]CAF4477441.1 unnamed protein product [Rotaria sp. Silwood2]CAF4618184.1 unnamed protein product [Rotaria sp. Silwood2]